ncbi:MAG TPA: HlyD family efflux transporter periplasmic adaptor subunit [Thermopetrobacter sp.]|nr:HlyD family efflux transporter periplasmic adaptor subunit [Thermopetrobacter sp.]
MAFSAPRPARPSQEERRRDGGRLERLLLLEADIRACPDLPSLELFAVNDTRAMLNFDQAVLFRLDRRGRAVAKAASGVVAVEKNAPLIRALNRLGGWLAGRTEDDAEARRLTRADLPEELRDDPVLAQWPHDAFLWLPLRDRQGGMFGALLLARREPWEAAEEVVGARVAGTLAHAMLAFAPPSLLRKFAPPRWLLLGLPIVVALLMLIPVPMSAIAPAEVVAADPVIVAAPMEGVIAEMKVRPNERVRAGQVLFVYDARDLKAQGAVARRELAVAQSRLDTLRKAAFSDPEARRKLAEAQAELELARAELERIETRLKDVQVRAPMDGVAVFADVADWVRRPVKTGEKVLEVADPQRVRLRIDVAVADAMALQPDATVRLFLDADPLNVLHARVRAISYQAREVAGGMLAYRVMADFTDTGERRGLLRMGLKGSAQVQGETVALGFYLFRRPIAALRQFTGL